jgi:hypothetical protein
MNKSNSTACAKLLESSPPIIQKYIQCSLGSNGYNIHPTRQCATKTPGSSPASCSKSTGSTGIINTRYFTSLARLIDIRIQPDYFSVTVWVPTAQKQAQDIELIARKCQIPRWTDRARNWANGRWATRTRQFWHSIASHSTSVPFIAAEMAWARTRCIIWWGLHEEALEFATGYQWPRECCWATCGVDEDAGVGEGDGCSERLLERMWGGI